MPRRWNRHHAPGCGLPIGNLTSQLFSNVYLNELDQYVKRNLGFRHYHHHLPDKKKVENRGLLSWAKYQRKRIKAGALDDERKRQFEELLDSRSDEHTGGRRKKISGPELWQ